MYDGYLTDVSWEKVKYLDAETDLRIWSFSWKMNMNILLFRYVGITMEVCMSDYRCCWDSTASPLNCFHPGGRNVNNDSSGMTIAGAVFLSIFIWGTLLALIVCYFLQKKGTNLPFSLPF